MEQICRLCAANHSREFARVHGRRFLRCDACLLTYVHVSDLPALERERAEYDLHENDPGDAGYRAFLSRLADPLLPLLKPGARGLDYGCGPGPALATMLGEQGLEMSCYDPIFAPDVSTLEQTYDFITCTETAEHFHRPGEEFERLAELLGAKGILAIMTGILDEDDRFENWSYVRDVTHVAIYRRETFEWIADRHGLDLSLPAKNVALLFAH